jgi:hypothetical protein
MNSIPPEIKEHIAYQPDTGKLVWIKPVSRRTKVGQEAGYIKGTGYRRVTFLGNTYRCHRVAWYLHHGEDPADKQIDHVNGDRDDNRIANLRLVTHSQNQQNRKTHLGTFLEKSTNKWMARIEVGDNRVFIGRYDCPLMAGLAYKAVRSVLHPYSVN